VLAGIAGVTMALGIAVGAGAVPQLGADSKGATIAASKIDELAPITRQPGDGTPDPVATTVPTTAAPTTVPPTTVAVAKATTPTTKAPARTTATTKAPAPTVTTPPAATAAAPSTPAATVTVARRVPSAAEVSSAIATLPQYVSTILTPTAAQVAQLGDQVCTAFDQGQTFAQVKATGLSMVTKLPLTTVKPGGADWVVKTVVTMYCPGHLSKLV
jgi:hypothetical protein